MGDIFQPGLRGYLRGKLQFYAAISDTPPLLNLKVGSGKCTVDRLHLSVTGADKRLVHIVLDTIPQDANNPSLGGTVITLPAPGENPFEVRISAAIRVLPIGCRGSLTRLDCTLTDGGGTGVALSNLAIDGQKQFGNLLLNSIGSEQLTGEVTGGYAVPIADGTSTPFFASLGLLTRGAVGAISRVRFAADSTESLFTPVLDYSFVLRRRTGDGQQVRLSEFQASWTDEELSQAGLCQLNSVGESYRLQPGAVTQSLSVDLQELRGPLPRDSSGKWVVTLSGFPSQGVVEAWNSLVVEPYLIALNTILSGQPVTLLPWLTIVDGFQGTALAEAPYFDRAESTNLLWDIDVNVHDRTSGERELSVNDFQPGASLPGRLATSLGRLQPMQQSANGTPWLQIIATFPGLQTYRGRCLQLPGQILPLAADGTPSLGFNFQLQWLAPPAGFATSDTCQMMRVGALDMALPPVPPAQLRPNADWPYRPPVLIRAAEAGRSQRPDAPIPLPMLDQTWASSFAAFLARMRIVPGKMATSLSVNLTANLAIYDVLPGGEDPTDDEEKVGPGSASIAGGETTVEDRAISARFAANRR